jgi:hypothetical protein
VPAGRKIIPVGPRVRYPRYEANGGSTAIARCVQTLRTVSINSGKFDHRFVQNRAHTRPTDQKHNKTRFENFSIGPLTRLSQNKISSFRNDIYIESYKQAYAYTQAYSRTQRHKKFTQIRDWVYCYTVNRLFCEVMWKRLEWQCASPFHYGLKITLDSNLGIN